MSAIKRQIARNYRTWITAVTPRRSNGRGKGSASEDEQYGLKKFRELMLELAVRGHLVKQDQGDEPASQLLKSISAEKERLIKEGKVKKARSYDFEGSLPLFDIPKTWKWTHLAEIGTIFNGNSVNASTKSNKYTGVEGLPFIATKDVGYGFEPLDYSNGISIPLDEPKFKVAKKGAVLICAEGGSAGKKCGITSQDICFGNKLFAIQLHGELEAKYILSLFLTPSFFSRFSASMTGIIDGISMAKFVALPVPIPPLVEQTRIVSIVDELMDLCNQLEVKQNEHKEKHKTLVTTVLDAIAKPTSQHTLKRSWGNVAERFNRLFTTEWSVEQLEKTILQLAVQGLLVPQDSNDEPASDLLKRIAAEKRRSTKNKMVRKQKPLPAIEEDEKPFQIPDGWEWVRIGDIAVIERGGSPRPIKSYITNAPDGLNWIKIGDTEKGGKYISSAQEKIRKEGLTKTRMVYAGDFLLTNSMSYGRPYISLIEGCIHDGWLRISPPDQLSKDFLYLLLSSPFLKKQFQTSAAGAVVMNLNADKVRDTLMLMPPIAEQKRIATRVDELMTICGKLKSAIRESQQTQLLMADAFTQQAVAATTIDLDPQA